MQSKGGQSSPQCYLHLAVQKTDHCISGSPHVANQNSGRTELIVDVAARARAIGSFLLQFRKEEKQPDD